ncbi:MAG: tRNA 2-thiouridine(34) synthase MnmA, partial [Patescibacteria group bacterium]
MKSQVTKNVFVAMSGGVDSSVAALLLKQLGYNVIGVYMKGWSLTGCAEEDATDARRVASVLDIPFYVFDFESEFKKAVVDYMVSEYAAGRTPNPDVMCNREIKFGLFLKKALALGADYIATGHYARVKQVKKLKVLKVYKGIRNQKLYKHYEPYKLLTAVDTNKDQTYFLWTLKQEQLAKTLFPIGDYIKPEIRKMAKKFGLSNHDKKDSQGVCFIGPLNMKDFLKNYIKPKRGKVLLI